MHSTTRRTGPLTDDDSADPRDSLWRLLDARLDCGGAVAAEFVPRLLERAGSAAVAVVHYGSCLVGMERSDSEPDFYLIVDDSWRVHPRLRDRLLAAFLPPSIYHISVEIQGRRRRCKLCVVSADQLIRETSHGASDLYHLGRFSKRIGLAWARDDAARRLVLGAQRSSLQVMAPLALAALGPSFTVEDLAVALLGLSYRAEVRLAEPRRARALLAADRPFYLAVARLLLALERRRGAPLAPDGPDQWRQAVTDDARARLGRWLRRSRRRAVARWPKHLITFDGWLDYVLGKLERHTGRRLDLTDMERRHPLALGWPRLLALGREGLLR